MIKLVCYGVRETEVKYFEEINKKFGYDIKLVLSGLNDENVKEAMGAEAIMVRGGCKADRQNLELNEYDVFFKDLTGQALEDKTKEKLISLYPKVLVTPHIGSYTDEALTNMIEYSYENLREYLNDGTCKNSIA